MSVRMKNFFHRRYWPAWVTLVAGLAASAGLARGIYRQAEKLDQQRFKLEANQIAEHLESTMERYEERLARLADACAQFDELPYNVWDFRSVVVTDLNYNLPNVIYGVYCPKIPAAEFAAHAERGQTVRKGEYRFDAQARPGRDFALPVWQCWSRSGFPAIPAGTDMVEEEAWHPSLASALARTAGWVSPAPVQASRGAGKFENGFWFGLPIFKSGQGPSMPWQRKGESNADAGRRHRAYYASVATGLLAVFISTDRMVDEAFNGPKPTPRLHVRLYADPEPALESLLNPGATAPVNPQYREVIVQAWYGRRWALELTTTPLFEAGSLRFRSWLVLLAGAAMTLLATALVGLGLRARNRQELLTDQIREARDALAAAEQQRQRLSHDLHDNTVQTLYAIQLGLGHTAQKLESEPEHAQHELSTVRAELDAVIAGIRRFITAEDNTEIAADLSTVLRTLVARAQIGAKANLELRCDPAASSRLAGSQAVQLANIAREALSNSLRHGKPQRVEIALRLESGAVCLEVLDDGAGFDPEATGRPGVGLASLASRAAELGGTLNIQSSPGHGTRLAVRVPASPPASDEPE